MKKTLIASLIAYLVLLFTVAGLMLSYVIIKKVDSIRDLSSLFTTVTVFFIVFLVSFILVVLMLLLYPRSLKKEYFVSLEPIFKEHVDKYHDEPYKLAVISEKQQVYISFIMENGKRDTYSFKLKDKPLTKKEVQRMVSNTVFDFCNCTKQ